MEKSLEKLKYIIIILLAIAIIIIFFNQYINIKSLIKAKYESRQKLVEKNILQTVQYINDAYQIAEQDLNQEMKKYSKIMLAKYKLEPEVKNWNLEKMKNEFKYYDIYIINRDLKIIKTTKKSDLGLDFSEFGSFTKVIRQRLESNFFAVDRIGLATQTGEVKKYSYQPTPDNQYLLELSISVEDKYSSFNQLNMFKDASYLTNQYPIVEEISFYSVETNNYGVAKVQDSKKPYLDVDIPKLQKDLARQTVLKKKEQVTTFSKNKSNYTLKFFPVLIDSKGNNQSWNAYVVGITYNDQVMKRELREQQYLFAINILLMLIFFIAFILVIIYLLNKFEYQANHDKLTGLANRKLFFSNFERLKEEADKSETKLGILFIDIDKFKMINDNYGHNIGDQVLKKIAKRLENNLKENDITARIGGDEFLAALANLNSETEIIQITKRLIAELENPIVIREIEIPMSISLGISIYPDDAQGLESLIKKADSKMYEAKANIED
ncbi:GGDEF domain-containing protein [Halanaerobium praevalens]|uniref:Diguanylate cyclase n=1 Tax=Halanaerobium praevalens (strain ATCC 33744 / DSM 2228 / GSL) TaxID=572479 RepID=E3DLZ9_HALPG|nr:GGDEF domain-containing protein [Halanaerobium praevalens]ADO76258.1 diguanylate cyclase [Halanaerobium praevalens DSM 2228]